MQAIEDGKKALEAALRSYEAPESTADTLDSYAGLLREERRWAGLSSRKLAEAPEASMAQSLTVLEVVDDERLAVVDIGSGGGLLGIPLAVSRPGWTVTLLERSGRKCAFLAEVIGTLGLKNARVWKGEAEAFAGHFAFDLALSRAAGGVIEMTEIALPLLASKGRYVALKGAGADDEAGSARDRLAVLGARLLGVAEAGIALEPGLPRTSLVVVEKL